MSAAVMSVGEGKGLREASRLYNVPVETLRRRVTGKVEVDCRSGPPTVLTPDEEEEIAHYLIEMADMGYGLTKDAVMCLVGTYITKCKRNNPFKDGKAGRWWFDGFKKRHPTLTIRMPQPLSYARALCSKKVVVTDFFGKLGSLYGKLNLISKPMQVFNADETGVTIVHKPGKVIAELGRKHVYSITSAERGRTHTVLSCISATGFVIPPCIIYPRKTKVPESFKEGAAAGVMYSHSKNGWINSDIYLEWFDFFLKNIPPARPVVLIQDGHASHISVQLIELARANGVHILCLPAHSTHLLQPLDLGVFKSFKVSFSKACSHYLSQHPGRVVTNDKIALLVSSAVSSSFTPNNIMGGFRKAGIYPLNPGAIDDKMLCPSKAFPPTSTTDKADPLPTSVSPASSLSKAFPPTSTIDTADPLPTSVSPASSLSNNSVERHLFTPEKHALFEKRYQEGYDIPDVEYKAWLQIMHPVDAKSGVSSDRSSSSSRVTPNSILQEMLVLPNPRKPKSGRKRGALNREGVCITDTEVLDKLKVKEEEKREKQRMLSEREEKRKAKSRESGRQKAAKGKKGKMRRDTVRKKDTTTLDTDLEHLNLGSSNEEDTAVCPLCGLVYPDTSGLWIGCDRCDSWFDIKCTDVDEKCIPDVYFCPQCRRD